MGWCRAASGRGVAAPCDGVLQGLLLMESYVPSDGLLQGRIWMGSRCII